MTIDETELRLAWERAVSRSRAARQAFAALVERHREPHRRYHGVRHVVWVVRHVTDLAGHEPVDDLGAVVVAACYHDAVYRPADDDEAASAALATRELDALDDPAWPAHRIETVAALVLATAHLTGQADASTSTSCSRSDRAVLLDADLAVLGARPDAYQAYVNGVRAEYGRLAPAEWRAGRRAVVERLLARPTIYRTPSGAERWEARARANLTAELAVLR